MIKRRKKMGDWFKWKGINKERSSFLLKVFLLCTVMFFFASEVAIASYEYDDRSKTWISHDTSEYNHIYGQNAEIGDEGDYTPGNIPIAPGNGILSKLVGAVIYEMSDFVNGLFSTHGIDLSVDGIVYGRMNRVYSDESKTEELNNMRMNVSHFGLERNNPWGIFGAFLYYNLRDRFALIVVPIVALFLIGKELFNNTAKGRARVKEVLKNIFFFFLLIMIVPYVLEIYIYVRDIVMYYTSAGLRTGMNSITGSGGVQMATTYEAIKLSYRESGGNIMHALLMFGYSFAGLVFFWDYIRIAMLLGVTFGLFPLVLIWWFFKPKILTDWLNLMLPGLLTPFIDMLLLMVPSFVSVVFTVVFKLAGGGADTLDLVLFLIMLACIWTARTARERILKMFGFEGIRGAGAGALGMAMMLLARGGRAGVDRLRPRSAADEPVNKALDDSYRHAGEQHRIGETMDSADNAIRDINERDYDVLGGGGRSNTDSLLEEMNNETFDDERSLDVADAVEVADADVADAVEVADDISAGDNDYVSAPELSDVDYEGMEASGEAEMDAFDDIMGMPNTPELSDVTERVSVTDVQVSGEGNGVLSDNVDMADKTQMDGMGHMTDSEILGDVPSGARAEAMAHAGGTSGADSLPPLSKEDAKFVQGLSDRDQKRFSNLRHMDDLEGKIAQNEKIMADSGYSRSAYEQAQAQKSELSRKMMNLTQEKAYIDQKRVSLETQNATKPVANYSEKMSALNDESNRNARAIHEVRSAQVENGRRVEALSSGYEADRRNTAYRRELDARRGVESQYAHNSGLGGMSTKTYSNASDFRYQKQVEQIKKQHVSYANFDSKQYDGILSPSEKEEFYRERAERMIREDAKNRVVNVVATGASVAAGVAAGTLGAAATVFSGPSTSMATGFVAGTQASRVAHRAADSLRNIEVPSSNPPAQNTQTQTDKGQGSSSGYVANKSVTNVRRTVPQNVQLKSKVNTQKDLENREISGSNAGRRHVENLANGSGSQTGSTDQRNFTKDVEKLAERERRGMDEGKKIVEKAKAGEKTIL